MGYDWKRLENDENQRVSGAMRPLGIVWMVVGLVGGVVALITGHPEKLSGLIVWLLLGAGIYLATRRGAKGKVTSSADDKLRSDDEEASPHSL